MLLRHLICAWTIVSFLLTLATPVPKANASLGLPEPGTMVNLSSPYEPILIKGLKVHPENPFLFDFIMDTGHSGLNAKNPALKIESNRLIKYFLAAMTVPEKDLWVNLSPYEKNRMIADNLGQTQMGQDMLAQDYILKQLTASLIYPERHLGKIFWDAVYAKARQMYGTTQVPVNTFNKVWIVADKADIFERGNVAYIVGAHLKVMLEEDYLALEKRSKVEGGDHRPSTSTLGSQIIREIILPSIEQEVNTGKNFAPLRQMYYSMILASWYKMALKEALLTQIYGNQSKVKVGVNANDPTDKDKIFEQYLKAYKKGVFNYIREDINQATKQFMPKKYFSGGEIFDGLETPKVLNRHQPWRNSAMTGTILDIVTDAAMAKAQNQNAAMTSSLVLTNITLKIVKTVGGKDTLYVEAEIYDRKSKRIGRGHNTIPAGTSAGHDERETENDMTKLLDQVSLIYKRIKESGLYPDQLSEIGQLMLNIHEKEGIFLGAQATLGVQWAIAQAIADARGIDLWEFLEEVAPDLVPEDRTRVNSQQQDNDTNGGVHADNELDMQEFMLDPVGKDIADSNRMDRELIRELGFVYQAFGLAADVNDGAQDPVSPLRGKEGGYKIPNLTKAKVEEFINGHETLKQNSLLRNFDFEKLAEVGPSPHEFVLLALKATILNRGYRADKSGEIGSVAISLDPAATEMAKDAQGNVTDEYMFEGQRRDVQFMINLYKRWTHDYPIRTGEDFLHEDHMDAWIDLLIALNGQTILVGDDLFVTQAGRLVKFIKKLAERGLLDERGKLKAPYKFAILIKFNQNGFVTTGNNDPEKTDKENYFGTIEVIRLARKHGFIIDMSHRSEEARAEYNETAIADASAAFGAEFSKFGTDDQPARRVKKDRLAYIDNQMRSRQSKAMLTKSTQAVIDCLEELYKKAGPNRNDEFIRPTAIKINGRYIGAIEPHDLVFLLNQRADRVLSMLDALKNPDFNITGMRFNTVPTHDMIVVPFAEYDERTFQKLRIESAFKTEIPKYISVSDRMEVEGVIQGRFAETNKGSHVTLFWDGRKKFTEQEYRQKNIHLGIVPSDTAPDEEKDPNMKYREVTDNLLEFLEANKGQDKVFAVGNLAKDIQGHVLNGDMERAKKTILSADEQIGRIRQKVKELNGVFILTSDHGNLEQVFVLDANGNFVQDEYGKIPSTQHADYNPVRFLIEGLKNVVFKDKKDLKPGEEFGLANVGPTVLDIMGIKPAEGMFQSLLKHFSRKEGKMGPVVLIIEDGCGVDRFKTPDSIAGDAIVQTNAPVGRDLVEHNPWMLLKAWGSAVGLPDDQMGDSDNGHTTMGAGRIVPTEFGNIMTQIKNGQFDHNPILIKNIERAIREKRNISIINLLSSGGVHSHNDFNEALLRLLARLKVQSANLLIKEHPELDGRDTMTRIKDQNGAYYLGRLRNEAHELGLDNNFIIGSFDGRKFGMDRDALNGELKKGPTVQTKQLWNERMRLAYEAKFGIDDPEVEVLTVNSAMTAQDMVNGLIAIKQQFQSLSPSIEHKPTVHLIIGNDSGDLDSVRGAIALALARSRHVIGKNVLFVPVINKPQEDFRLMTHVTSTLKDEFGIAEDQLVFNDTFNIKKLIEQGFTVKITLVDHNKPIGPYKDLKNNVVEVIDHHTYESGYYGKEVSVNIVTPMGSATTLIAETIEKEEPGLIENSADFARWLLEPIVFDTANLKEDPTRTTQRDVEMAKLLANISKTNDTAEIFDNLKRAKARVSQLPTYDVIRTDKKLSQEGRIPYGTLAIDVGLTLDDITKKAKAEGTNLIDVLKQYSSNNGLQVIVGFVNYTHPTEGFKREMFVFSDNTELAERLGTALSNDDGRKTPFQLSSLSFDLLKDKRFRAYSTSIKASRKEVVDNDPVFKKFLRDFAMNSTRSVVSTNAFPGGIDFNRAQMQMNVRKEGRGVQMQFDPAMVARIKRQGFDGLDFKIKDIVPINLPIFLGLRREEFMAHV